MHNSTLIRLLSKLEKTEYKTFDKFVRSPYFNSNNTITDLWELLKKYAPAFDSPKLNKEKIYLRLFPKQAYKDKRMWQLMSDLKGLVEQFLVIEKKEKNSLDFQIDLRAVYSERSLYDWFEQKTKTLETRLCDENDLDVLNLYHLHQINDQAYYNNQSNKTFPNPENLVGAFAHLQSYFYIQELRYACEWASRAYRISEEKPLFVQNITYRSQFANNLLYSIYYDLLLLLTDKEKANDENFESLSAKICRGINKFPKKDQCILLLTLINHGSRKAQMGAVSYNRSIFDLLNIGLEVECFIYKGILETNVFVNIIILGSKLKLFAWLDIFLLDYSDYLEVSIKQETLLWAKAIIEYQKGQFKQAVQTYDTFHKKGSSELARRSVQIKACLECYLRDESYYELLINKIQSFDKYLQRETILSDTKKAIYSKQNRIIKTLANLLFRNQPKEKFLAFEREVAAMDQLVNKEWFLNHIRHGRIKQPKQKIQTV